MKKLVKYKKNNIQKNAKNLNSNECEDSNHDTYSSNENNFAEEYVDSSVSISDTRNCLPLNQSPLHTKQFKKIPTGKFNEQNVDIPKLGQAQQPKGSHFEIFLKNKKSVALESKLPDCYKKSCDSNCESGYKSTKISQSPTKLPDTPYLTVQHIEKCDKYALSTEKYLPIDPLYSSFGRHPPNRISKLPNERTFDLPYADIKINKEKSIYGIREPLLTNKASTMDYINNQHRKFSHIIYPHNSRQHSPTFVSHRYSALEPALPLTMNNSSTNSVHERSLYKFSHTPSHSSFKPRMSHFTQNFSILKNDKRKLTHNISSFQKKLPHIGKIKRPLTFTDVEFIETVPNKKTIQIKQRTPNHRLNIQRGFKHSIQNDARIKVSDNSPLSSNHRTIISPSKRIGLREITDPQEESPKRISKCERIDSNFKIHDFPFHFSDRRRRSPKKPGNFNTLSNKMKTGAKHGRISNMIEYKYKHHQSTSITQNKHLNDNSVKNEILCNEFYTHPKSNIYSYKKTQFIVDEPIRQELHGDFTTKGQNIGSSSHIHQNNHRTPYFIFNERHTGSSDLIQHQPNSSLNNNARTSIDDVSDDQMMYDAAIALLNLKNLKE